MTAFRLHRGFTLLEMSIVVAVVSLLLGSILAFITQDARITKQAELKSKMDVIEDALIAFRKLNDRIPCPGDLTATVGATTFGYEAANAGSCTGGTPTANFSTTAVKIVSGTIPVRTLALPDEAMIDPWGGRFTYNVAASATATSAFTTYPVTSNSIGGITVSDVANVARTTSAVAVVISHGPNGHGAYQLSGSRKSFGSTNSNEQKNCHCSATGLTTTFDRFVVQQANTLASGDALTGFDDVVRYYTRSQLNSISDLITEER